MPVHTSQLFAFFPSPRHLPHDDMGNTSPLRLDTASARSTFVPFQPDFLPFNFFYRDSYSVDAANANKGQAARCKAGRQGRNPHLSPASSGPSWSFHRQVYLGLGYGTAPAKSSAPNYIYPFLCVTPPRVTSSQVDVPRLVGASREIVTYLAYLM